MPRLKKRYRVNFPNHMAVCEFNYRRLCRLMPGWRENESSGFQAWFYLAGQHPQEMAINVEVSDSAKYTTTVHITVAPRLQNQAPWVKNSTVKTGKGLERKNNLQNSSKQIHSVNPYKRYSLEVRLYHDATVAEVVAWQGHRGFQPVQDYPNPRMHQRDEKAQLNNFLGELLEFCLLAGRVNRPIMTSSLALSSN